MSRWEQTALGIAGIALTGASDDTAKLECSLVCVEAYGVLVLVRVGELEVLLDEAAPTREPASIADIGIAGAVWVLCLAVVAEP